MARLDALHDVHPADIGPAVRKIGVADLRHALERGVDDFMEQPSHLFFIGLIYPVVGLVLARLTFGYEVLPLLYPLVAGFALVGPFAAIGIYEISRRREAGMEAGLRHVFSVLRSPAIDSIAALGLLLMAIFIAWLFAAQTVYASIFGDAVPESLSAFMVEIVTTRAGWTLILIGNGVGLLFATLVLAISVVSFPLMLDRDVGAAAAVRTSVRAVLANPGPMALWGVVVAVALALGSLPFLFGLAVVVPVLGHATWHLYRRAVEP